MSENRHKIGIITTGSEIISGCIADLNCRWLSQRISDLGLEVAFQMSCTDKNSDIEAALHFLTEHCGSIIITGGLGPTQDDLTRQSVAKFYQQQLQLSQESWRRLVTTLGVDESEISPRNRQQCYFPEAAVILPNSHGTADGFYCKDKVDTFVLPGPPRENQPMFDTYVVKHLPNLAGQCSKAKISWTTLGIPESRLADMCSEAFADLPVELGFRAHFPTVELKFEIPTDKFAALESVFKDFQLRLGDALVATEKNFDLPRKVLSRLANYKDVQVVDLLTNGQVNRDLSGALDVDWQQPESLSLLTQIDSQQSDFEFLKSAYGELSDSSLMFLLAPEEKKSQVACVLVKSDKFQTVSRFTIPERIFKRGPHFQRSYASYRALLQIERDLSASAPDVN